MVAAFTGCGAPRPGPALAPDPAPDRSLIASSARLAAPRPVDPAVRGASYLTAVAAQLQPKWSVFLEDCRLRLPRTHPLNQPALAATFELVIGSAGELTAHREVASSGNGDFDTAVADVLADASPLPEPPGDLASDDDLVHVRWQFARDARQAGAATARVVQVELPLLEVVTSLIGRGELMRAATRVAASWAAPAAAADRDPATERVMIAALREAITSPNGVARRTAVEACGRARVHALADDVRGQLAATTDPELRLAAITSAGALGDRAAAPALLAALPDDLTQHPRVALARVAALVAIGQAADAAAALRAVLDAGPNPTALAALRQLPPLATAPVPAIAAKLAAWAAAGDAATRGAVCMALPAAAPAPAAALIARGLRDADARVRAACAEAAGRTDAIHPDAATVKRLHELAHDRDLAVRARAVAALGRLDPAHPIRAADDPAPAVRAAFATTAAEPELRVLAGDREPDVRAAAVIALGDRAHDIAVRAAADPSPQVRQAAIAALGVVPGAPGTAPGAAPGDAELLARLARDAVPDVALAALVRLVGLRGRAAMAGPLLDQLVAAPAGSPERARIALAWLLAS